MRTITWEKEQQQIRLIDQRLLPSRFEFVICRNALESAEAIRSMVVRGAPAIGVTGAYGIAAEACRLVEERNGSADLESMRGALLSSASILRNSRPTAVNLAWAVDQMTALISAPADSPTALRDRLVDAAEAMAEEDIRINRKMAEYGAALIEDGDTIIHHCNTGALAAVDWGTALGCIRMAHEQGKRVHVLVDETRPRLQGARLTAWELSQWGIPYEIITDNMAGYFLSRGEVQKVFFGADRIAANGDVANKIGTYMLSLAAHHNRLPVFAVAPSSTFDLNLSTGNQIPIEERDPDEVLSLQINGEPVVPLGAKARNPAFDITPHQLITALVTEKGVIYPPFTIHIARMLGES